MNLIIIIGQTATGKTKLALELSKKITPAGGGELINFDSRQIYKYLDIITGKDIPKTKIRLYDIVTPDQYFSSYDYVQFANEAINDIQKRGKTPILVGGTYFYLKHLLYGFDYKVPPNLELREKLNSKSVDYLQKMLIKLNKTTFENLNHSDQLNPRRLIRKIEIEKHRQTLFKKTPINPMNPISPISQFIGLKYKDKNKLRQAIKTRVEKRLKLGAIEEVKKLLKMGYKPTDPGLKTIGCQQIIKYLNNQLSKKQTIKDWVNKEVQYAKRQYTFMKKDKNIEWREI